MTSKIVSPDNHSRCQWRCHTFILYQG